MTRFTQKKFAELVAAWEKDIKMNYPSGSTIGVRSLCANRLPEEFLRRIDFHNPTPSDILVGLTETEYTLITKYRTTFEAWLQLTK
jgi:hypothetical protein